MKVLLLVNPYASAVSQKTHRKISKILEADCDLSEKFTAKRGHAVELAKDAAKSGFDVICVLGGDGTLNETANGLKGTDTALAPLPGGSTNVLARSLGLSHKPVKAALQTRKRLQACAKSKNGAAPVGKLIGLGKVNERYFLFNAGVGFDATVVERVEHRGDLKRWLRHIHYAWEVVATLLWHFDKDDAKFCLENIVADSPETTIGTATTGTIPGVTLGATSELVSKSTTETTPPTSQMAICLNNSPYTYLGNRALDIAPQAGLDSGLALLFVDSLTLSKLLRVAVKALKGGDNVANDESVTCHYNVSGFDIQSESPVAWQVDGDLGGKDKRLEIRYVPEALRLITE